MDRSRGLYSLAIFLFNLGLVISSRDAVLFRLRFRCLQPYLGKVDNRRNDGGHDKTPSSVREKDWRDCVRIATSSLMFLEHPLCLHKE